MSGRSYGYPAREDPAAWIVVATEQIRRGAIVNEAPPNAMGAAYP